MSERSLNYLDPQAYLDATPFQSKLPLSTRDAQVVVGLPEPYRLIHVMERPPEFLLSYHSHRWYHINYLFSGSVDIHFQGKQITAHEGQVFVLPPQLPHKLFSREGYMQLGLDVLLSQDTRKISQMVQDAFANRLSIISIPRLSRSFQEVLGIVQGMSPLDMLLLINIAETMLFETMQVNRAGDDLGFKKRFLKMLQQTDPFSLTIDEMCRRMNLSKTHLERLANRELGCSATKYCSKLKCSRACILLQVSNKSVKQIAEELAFYDESHFNVFFKRMMGMPPGTYRRLFRSRNGQVQNLSEEVGRDVSQLF